MRHPPLLLLKQEKNHSVDCRLFLTITMPQYDDGTSSALKQTRRYITTHDESGKAVLVEESVTSEEVKLKRLGNAAFNVLYHTDQTPVVMQDNNDLKTHLSTGTVPIAVKGGTVLRMVDIAPGTSSPMHVTNSLDYGVVLEGEVELILEDMDKGPRRIMGPGDVSVQRATMHAWRNTSETAWARMLYVLVDASDGKKEEDWGGIELPPQ